MVLDHSCLWPLHSFDGLPRSWPRSVSDGSGPVLARRADCSFCPQQYLHPQLLYIVQYSSFRPGPGPVFAVISRTTRSMVHRCARAPVSAARCALHHPLAYSSSYHLITNKPLLMPRTCRSLISCRQATVPTALADFMPGCLMLLLPQPLPAGEAYPPPQRTLVNTAFPAPHPPCLAPGCMHVHLPKSDPCARFPRPVCTAAPHTKPGHHQHIQPAALQRVVGISRFPRPLLAVGASLGSGHHGLQGWPSQ